MSPTAPSTMVEQLTVQQDYLRSRMDPHYLPPLPPKPKVVFGCMAHPELTVGYICFACYALAEADVGLFAATRQACGG